MPYADPEAQRAAVRESQRRRRAAEGKTGGKTRRPLPELAELRYTTLSELLAVLGDEIDQVRGSALDLATRARLLAYLVATAARLVEGVGLEQRLAEVERILADIGETDEAVSHAKH